MSRWLRVLFTVVGVLVGLGIVALAIVFTPWWYLTFVAIVGSFVLYWGVQIRLDRRALAAKESLEPRDVNDPESAQT
jgi:hypothetical protein